MSDVLPHPSMRQGIASLAMGESFARAERLELELLTKERVVEQTAALRNTISSAMRRAASDTGNDYAVETGAFLTANRDLMLVAVVTRRG